MDSRGKYVDVGTNVDYVRHLIPVGLGGIYKGRKITGNFLTDTLEQKNKEIVDIFAGKLWKPFK